MSCSLRPLHTVAGSEFRVVLDFADAPGAIPTGGLLFHESRLYGTTSYGGQVGWGTIFSVDAQGGDFRLLYSMADPQPGNSQVSNLVLSGNKLFGTTFGGGQGEQGTVFSST